MSAIQHVTIPGIPGTFAVTGFGPAHHSSLPLIIVPGWTTYAGDRIVESTPGRIAFAGDRRAVSRRELEAEMAALAAARASSEAQWDAYRPLSSAWYAARAAYVAAAIGPKPERRPVKAGRRITRREGRAMALDMGFDPSLCGYRHEDPTDAALADADHRAALDAWYAARDAAESAYGAEHPAPAAPDVPPPVCSDAIVARHAGLFGFGPAISGPAS